MKSEKTDKKNRSKSEKAEDQKEGEGKPNEEKSE